MKYKVISVIIISLFFCSVMAAQQRDSLFSADTAALPALQGSSHDALSGLMPPYGDVMEEYSAERFGMVMRATVSPLFYGTLDIRPYYTAVYSFNGLFQEHYIMMPLSGNLHAFMGRRDIDMINLYRYQSAYIGGGVQLLPWLEVNGGGLFGISMPRDRKPLPTFGGMMSVVITPSENASMMIWGSYANINAMGAPTFNPVTVPSMNIGASVKFKIGDATIGVGASVSTFGR